MDAAESSSTIGEHIRGRLPKKHPTNNKLDLRNPNISSLIQSTRCKSSISSLFLSPFTNSNNNNNNNNPEQSDRKKSYKNSSLRGFGCTAQPEVSVPAVIREEYDRDNKNNKRNKKRKGKKKMSDLQLQLQLRDDLWCGPGIGAHTSADCVVSARPISGRGKIDVNKQPPHRERASYSSRHRVNTEQFASLNLDSAFEIPRYGLDVYEDSYHHNFRGQSHEGLAEIMMFQNGLVMERRSGGQDRYRDLRLDVDNMTYEDLLELGERIGYVSTGLGEDQIGRCIRRTKLSVLHEMSSSCDTPVEAEGKCSICQEEFDAEDEVGRLECEHAYHLYCIKQWLTQKNACPVCKSEASCQ